MSYRCIDAFEFCGVIYPGGLLVDDDNPILTSHKGFFVRVADAAPVKTETATAAPSELRAVAPAPARKATHAKRSATVKSTNKPEEGE